MSFGPVEGNANGPNSKTIEAEGYKVSGQLPAPVKQVGRNTVKFQNEEQEMAFNNYFNEDKAIDIGDGRERGLTKIRNLLKDFDNDSAFDLPAVEASESDPSRRGTHQVDPSRKGTVKESEKAGFVSMVE